MATGSRRSFLAGAAGSAGALHHAAQAGRSAPLRTRISPLDGIRRQNIKITGVRLISLAYRLKPAEEWADGASNMIIYKTESVIAEVTTDAGLKGIGACSRYNGAAAMKEYLENVVRPFLAGKNPFDVESLTGGIAGHGPRGVWAGVDVALWDIIGKATAAPSTNCLPPTPSRRPASAPTPVAANSPGTKARASPVPTTL